MLGVLFIVLGLALGGLCLVSIFRNLFSRFNLLDRGIKNKIVILFFIGVVICAALIIADGNDLYMYLGQLKYGVNLSPDEISYLKFSISQSTKSALILTLIGYALFALQLFIFKEIRKEIDREIEKNSKDAWKI